MSINDEVKPYLIAELFLTNQLNFKDIIHYKNGRYTGPLIVIDVFINTHRKKTVEIKRCKLTKEHNYEFNFNHMIIKDKKIKLWDSEVFVSGTYIEAPDRLLCNKVITEKTIESEFIVKIIRLGKINITNSFNDDELKEVSDIVIKEIECT